MDQINERCRDVRGVGAVDEIRRNLQYASRTLLERPASLVTIVILALGIGANSAVFSVLDTALLRPLPFSAADRLVLLESPLDAVTFAAVIALVLATVALSSLWPALRAARIDPIQVLRDG